MHKAGHDGRGSRSRLTGRKGSGSRPENRAGPGPVHQRLPPPGVVPFVTPDGWPKWSRPAFGPGSDPAGGGSGGGGYFKPTYPIHRIPREYGTKKERRELRDSLKGG